MTYLPIPKHGKDHTNPSNYRPIALTSSICKTFETMITNRLVWYLEYNGIDSISKWLQEKEIDKRSNV